MAGEGKSIQPNITYADESTLLVPCEPKEFGRFLSGLLGQTQTISRRLKTPYELRRQDVTNIYALVDHRIKSQNDATVVEFGILTAYDDGSSIRLNSMEEFNRYAEVKPLISTDCTLQWKILIKFPNEKVPQRQEIGVSFVTYRTDAGDYDSRDLQSIYDFALHDYIAIRVEHTDRTWGADIENMLVAHMGMLFKPDPEWRVFIRNNSTRVGYIIGAIVIAGAFIAVMRASSAISDKFVTGVSGAPKGLEQVLATMGRQQDLLAAGIWERYAIISVMVLIASVIIGIFLGGSTADALKRVKRSYVLFTEKSVEQRDKEARGRATKVLSSIAYLILSVIIAVVGNYAFAYAVKIWAP